MHISKIYNPQPRNYYGYNDIGLLHNILNNPTKPVLPVKRITNRLGFLYQTLDSQLLSLYKLAGVTSIPIKEIS